MITRNSKKSLDADMDFLLRKKLTNLVMIFSNVSQKTTILIRLDI